MACAASFLAAPSVAFAEGDLAVLSPASDWQLRERSDRCSLTRTFGEDEVATRLTIDKGSQSPTFNLTIVGRPVRNPHGSVISVQFGPGEKAFGRGYISAKTRSGKGAIVMYGASFSPAEANEDGSYTIDELDVDRLSDIGFLQVERAGLKPFKLDFAGSLAGPVTSLRQCMQDLESARTIASAGATQPAKPASNSGKWVLPQDYPPMMLRYRQNGEVLLRLTVAKSGKATFCTIDSSSLPQMFDDAVCLALLRNAEFTPALDKNSQPMVSYWWTTVKFQVR